MNRWLRGEMGKLFLCLICVCSGTEWCSGTAIAGLVKITEKDYGRSGCQFILQDEESSKALFNAEERGFYVNEPLQVKYVRKKELLVRFYSPRPARNVVIWGKWKGLDEQVKLAEFTVLKPFAEFRIPLFFMKSDALYFTRSGKRILVSENRHPELLETEVECEDPYYQKIVSTQCRWHISFGAYKGKHWTPLLPAHAREAVAIALNLAYLFSTEEFAKGLWERQGQFYSDNNRTEVNVKELYERIFELKALVYGHVTGVNGLGGGYIFGLAEWCYLEHYADDKNVTRTVFHEFSHCLGYNHTGNMTYENGLGKGWVAFCSALYSEMCIRQELPVYSRRFLATRQCQQRYGHDYFQKSCRETGKPFAGNT